MKEKIRILSTVCIYHALNDGAVATIPILFPIFKSFFDLNYTQVGAITGGGLLITLISQIMIGRTADGKNSRTLLSGGLFLVSLSLLLLSQSMEFLTLILFIYILRFSSSFFHPIGVGWVSRIFKKDRLDWAMGIQSGLADAGAFISISTTLYLTKIGGWRFPLQLWSLAVVAGVVMGVILTRNTKTEYLIAKKIIKKQGFRETLMEGLDFLKKIKIIVPAFMVSGASWGVTITFLPLLLNEKTDLSLPIIGVLTSIWIGAGSLTSFFYGSVKSFIGRKNVVISSYFAIGVMGLFLSYFTNTILIIGIVTLFGAAVFITYPALFSFVSEVTHESAEGKTFGIIFTLQLGGGTALLFIGGVLADVFGIWMPFATLGFLSLILACMLLFNYKKSYATC